MSTLSNTIDSKGSWLSENPWIYLVIMIAVIGLGIGCYFLIRYLRNKKTARFDKEQNALIRGRSLEEIGKQLL